VSKRVGTLIVGTLILWVVVAYPAFLLGGESGLLLSASAAGLCLIPTALTLLLDGWSGGQPPEQQLVVAMGGTGVRMGVVLGAGLLLYLTVPFFARQGFWLWILLFYLFTLALEMVLIVRGKMVAEKERDAISAPPSS